MFFLVRHIDSLIQIGLGLAFTWIAYRSPSMKFRNVFRVCGPALVVIGGVLMLMPTDTPNWRRQATGDHAASAEFPGAPTREEATDTLGAVSVQRESFSYDVPGSDVYLAVSSSTMAPEARALTEDQRIEAMINLLATQGSRLVTRETRGSVHDLTLRNDAQSATMHVAVIFEGDRVYRAIASWVDGSEDPSTTDRFIRSFRLEGS